MRDGEPNRGRIELPAHDDERRVAGGARILIRILLPHADGLQRKQGGMDIGQQQRTVIRRRALETRRFRA